MRIIPVIDLQHGQVVRGVAGQRDEYRPVSSRIADRPTPASLANALARQFAFDEVYVADLDAIAGAHPDRTSYDQIAAAGLRLWVDAGVHDAARATQVVKSDSQIAKVVVGLESIDSPAVLQEVFTVIPSGQAVFSLDLKHGLPITQSSAWGNQDAESIASTAAAIGFPQIIVLDLAFVGTEQGIGVASLCRRLKQVHPQVEVIAGGGVRGMDDLRSLAAAGCTGALVASALHNGQLTKRDVAAVKDLGVTARESRG